MKTRVITAIFILAIAIPIVIFSQYIVYPIALSLLSGLAVFEMLRVIKLHNCLRISLPAYLIALAMPISSYLIFNNAEYAGYRVVYLLLMFVALFIYLIYIMAMAVFSHGKITVAGIAVTFLSVSYVVASFASLSTIRYLDVEAGMYNLMLVFFISWGCDTSAYFFGTFLGKHKLIPDVSPKKSVEGAIGGIIGAVGLSLGFAACVNSFAEIPTNYIAVAACALVLSVVSQVGDLIASLIKREYGVKDYGKLMPGHGGVMDRFDSILAVATPLLFVSLFFPPFGTVANLI